jgi:streptogramin lyase
MPRTLASRGIRAAALVVAATAAGACIEPRNDPTVLDAAAPDTRRLDRSDAGSVPDGPESTATPVGTGAALGAACETGDQCAGGNCVDGRCCASAACGVCQRCGSAGRCGLVADEEDDTCRTPAKCNAAGLCVRYFFEFALPAGVQPDSLTSGPDGNIWFVQTQTAKVARMTPAGMVTELAVLDPLVDRPRQIISGPDGNLWITLPSTSKVARLNPSGTITAFDLRGSSPQAIAVGPDGNLWVTQMNASGLGRITPGGVYQPVMINDFRAFYLDLVLGTDANLWALGSAGIARVMPSGLEMRFALPFPGPPQAIAPGPDNALWFTVPGRRSIGRISHAGVVTELMIPDNGEPFDIVAAPAPDGVLWFSDPPNNALSRLTTNGTVTRFPVPTPGSRPTHLTIGPDRAVWFVESATGKIGRLRL